MENENLNEAEKPALSKGDVSGSTVINHKRSIGELNLFIFFFVRWKNIKIEL